MQARAIDLDARDRLHQVGVGQERVEVHDAPEVVGAENRDQRHQPGEEEAFALSPRSAAERGPEQHRPDKNREEMSFGASEAGAGQSQAAADRISGVCFLPGAPGEPSSSEGQQHGQALLEPSHAPEGETARRGEPHRGPQVRTERPWAVQRSAHSCDEQQQPCTQQRPQDVANLNQVEFSPLEGRHEHRPEEIRVALDPFISVEGHASARDEVSSVTKGNVRIVLDPAEADENARAVDQERSGWTEVASPAVVLPFFAWQDGQGDGEGST